MKKTVLVGTGVALLLAYPTAAIAQRADENAVKAADDAFGTSVGNEKIGLYSASDVRGFSPVNAGNIRIEGLSVTEHGGFTNRIVSGSTIRVGLTAQGYPFPAPTGIADYSLRSSGNDAIFSPVIYLGPIRNRASGPRRSAPDRPRSSQRSRPVWATDTRRTSPARTARTLTGGGVLRWRPSGAIEIKSFYGRTSVKDDLDIPSIFTAGPYLPPRIERRNFGLDYTGTDVERQYYGGLGSAQLSENWQVRAGLFRWESDVKISMTELFRNVQRDGSGQRQLVATRDQRAESTSGELRSSYSLTEGARRHTIHLAARGRITGRAYGGADVRNLGTAVIGTRDRRCKTRLRFRPADERQGPSDYRRDWLRADGGLRSPNSASGSRKPTMRRIRKFRPGRRLQPRTARGCSTARWRCT